MMETTQWKAEKEVQLPKLIKQSPTYKLFVPKKVEEKIRYLINKFPHTEWSGILFIKHTGSFENNDLEIHCEDLYPMDLGTTGWTEFKMTEDVTAYIADNITELFDCDIALVHSHHTMGAFFSGQDINTLRTEGNDTNCFVSLIVDTRGTYQAAITRKIQKKTEVVTKSLGSSYEFFGEGEIRTDEDPMSEVTKVVDEEVIEYFMLDVQREVVENPFEALDKRFDEIEAKKKQSAPVVKVLDDNNAFFKKPAYKDFQDNDYSFQDYLKKKDENKQLSLFSDEEMDEMVDTSAFHLNDDDIHRLTCKMVTCSFFINKDVDLNLWISNHMVEKYKTIFPTDDLFTMWKDYIIDFVLDEYDACNIDADSPKDYDIYRSLVAEGFYDELCTYPENEYIKAYMDALISYIYI